MKKKTLEDIREIYIQYRNGKISLLTLETKLNKLPKKLLSEFIGEAFSKGWISPFNMGTD